LAAEIRSLRSEELDDSFRLSQFAFQYELSPEELERSKQRTDPSLTWGWFEDGQLAAKATFLRLKLFVGGEAIPMGGVAGVATWPEHRRSGKVEALLKHGLQLMRERGETVSMLSPFSYPFYARYGWSMLTERKTYTLAAGQISHLHAFQIPAGGSIRRVDPQAEWALLNEIYRPYAARYNGMLDRDERWWKNSVLRLKRQAAVYTGADGTPAGYLLYNVSGDELKVHEAVWLDGTSRSALLKFLANHDSMAKSISLTLPVSDRLPYLLEDPRVKQEVNAYFMFRVVDLERFIAAYRFAGPATELSLDLTDPHAPWNNGTYLWQTDSEGRATRIRREPTGHGDPIRCEIRALSAMMIGAARPSFLREGGRLSGSDEAIRRWEAALPQRETYLADFF